MMTAPPDDRETLAEWMRDRYATGHGDSVRDLLKELTWQIEERVSAAREEGRRQGAREMLPDIEAVAAQVHADWMEAKHADNITSRLSETGEELMVPYAELSEAAK